MKLNKGWGVALVVLGLVVLTSAVIDFLPERYIERKVEEQVAGVAPGIAEGLAKALPNLEQAIAEEVILDDANATLEEGTLTVEMGDAKKLLLENPVGRIKVTGQADAKQVTVKYKKKLRGLNEEEAVQRLAEEVKIDSSRTGDAMRVATKIEQPLRDMNLKGLNVDYEIVVPQGLEVVVRNDVGEVETRGLLSPVDIQQDMGKVTVDGFKGEAKAKVDMGQIKVGGGQDVKNVSLEVDAGTIQLGLPSSVNVKLDAETDIGTIQTDFSVEAGKQGMGRSIHSQIGDGSAGRVTLKTDTGEINIRKE